VTGAYQEQGLSPRSRFRRSGAFLGVFDAFDDEAGAQRSSGGGQSQAGAYM
jgi:hypothetical protein